LANL
jgi:glyoxylase-like metal-dependent hydrolase (beta-lactamase superfamily II)